MELWVSHLEHALADGIGLLKVTLEAIAAFTILWGLIKTAQVVLKMRRERYRHQTLDIPIPLPFIRIRLTFGMWLALALEFQLGADILATTISPNFESLGRLGAIALIRTFLNYFLNKELAEEFQYQEKISMYTPPLKDIP